MGLFCYALYISNFAKIFIILFFVLCFFIIFEYTNHRNAHPMEKVTLTKLYETLAQKVGRNEAECLTQYVEIKVKDELNTKTEILATKVSVKDECLALKEDILSLRSELKEDIYVLRSELTGEIHALRTEMKDNTISLQMDAGHFYNTCNNDHGPVRSPYI